MQPTLYFSVNVSLVWPVVGNILINYSMDKTIYFPTLDQYKYNPAIVIQANEGDMITAAAAGKVTLVFTLPNIRTALTIDLGTRYQDKYVEGTNVYFKLTKDGEPVNPMTRLS